MMHLSPSHREARLSLRSAHPPLPRNLLGSNGRRATLLTTARTRARSQKTSSSRNTLTRSSSTSSACGCAPAPLCLAWAFLHRPSPKADFLHTTPGRHPQPSELVRPCRTLQMRARAKRLAPPRPRPRRRPRNRRRSPRPHTLFSRQRQGQGREVDRQRLTGPRLVGPCLFAPDSSSSSSSSLGLSLGRTLARPRLVGPRPDAQTLGPGPPARATRAGEGDRLERVLADVRARARQGAVGGWQAAKSGKVEGSG